MTEHDQPNGILIVDKPVDLTSHDVVSRVRRILKTKRVGHTGTLDPFATGVLVLLVGKATRLAQFIDKDEKEYEALVKFGFETDTGDKTGTRTFDNGLSDKEIGERLNVIDWDDVLGSFRGEIEQIPPMYSAKKVEGKKLYELARAGKAIERKPIKVEIKELELIDDPPTKRASSDIRIRVVCSAGTYIRTLAEDIGRHIGVGAHLLELRRTQAGRFDLKQSVTLDELESAENATWYLRPIEDAVLHLLAYNVNDERVEKTKNGLPTRIADASYSEEMHVRMLDPNGRLIAIGKFEAGESQIRPTIVVA